MLKTYKDNQAWLVTQPDHGAAAGYLAAHWGNEQFARPGYHAPALDAARLRAETVLAIGEHDNGWLEWEADPQLSEVDGLPLGLGEVLKNQQDGMDRWRRGIPRLDTHPYVSLLIAGHARSLYAVRTEADFDPAFRHPLFWRADPEKLIGGSADAARAFVAELEGMEVALLQSLRGDPTTADWVEGENWKAGVRLLQLLDGLSLGLTSPHIPARQGESLGLGRDSYDLQEVPRMGWSDRVTISVEPAGEGRVRLDPYPFDLDPLPVRTPARVVDMPAQYGRGEFQSWWRAGRTETLEVELVGPLGQAGAEPLSS